MGLSLKLNVSPILNRFNNSSQINLIAFIAVAGVLIIGRTYFFSNAKMTSTIDEISQQVMVNSVSMMRQLYPQFYLRTNPIKPLAIKKRNFVKATMVVMRYQGETL
ncbi:MAG: hypothetical protein GY927_10435 [bacterium]|nr:hypothetical protein [bacterium]